MKYLAIVDDELLSNFRVDVRSNNLSEMVLVVTDDAGSTRGIGLIPLQHPMIVSEEG